MKIDKQKLLDWVESEITESNETAMKWVAYNIIKGKFDDDSAEKERDKLKRENAAMKEALEWVEECGTDYQSVNKAKEALFILTKEESA